MSYTVLATLLMVILTITGGIFLFIKLINRGETIEGLTILICAAIIAGALIIDVSKSDTFEEVAAIEDCQTQFDWLNKNVHYIMTFRFKEGDRVVHQIVFRIDGTAETEYRVSANTECGAIKKAVPIASAYFEAQKQVEEVE